MKKIFFYTLLTLFWGCGNTGSESTLWVDLTHTLDSNALCWPIDSNSKFIHIEEFRGKTAKGYYYSSCRFSTPEHCGTHLDAPIHFAEGKWTIDQIPLTSLMGEGYIIDVLGKVNKNKDYQIEVADVLDFEKKYGQIPENSIIIFKTGYGKLYSSYEASFGTKIRGHDAIANFHFPGVLPELAKWLVMNRKPKLVGIDTPSMDYGQSTDFETHQIFLGSNIPQLENVANLDALKSFKIKINALPLKIGNGTGAPVRIVGLDL